MACSFARSLYQVSRQQDLIVTDSLVASPFLSEGVIGRSVAEELIEGVDFSIVFYGGALLARLSAEMDANDDPTLVDLWRINRRMWLVMDSDRGEGDLKPAVQRLRDEIANAGTAERGLRAGTRLRTTLTRSCWRKPCKGSTARWRRSGTQAVQLIRLRTS